jgi:long-chain acyl-CoA synthetase
MIVAGHNVYPTEIETVLLEDPMITDAAVAALQDEVRGEEVIAFAVPASNAKLTERDILSRCRQVLVPYKVPRRVVLVDSIPRNETGKILRKALLELVDVKRES